MPIYDCSPYIAQAKAAGISDAQIDAFRAANTNADGTWDCHRLIDAFVGAREQAVGSVTAAQIAVVNALPPISPALTAGGDQRMFLSLSGVPTAAGGGMPARQLAPIVSAGAPSFGSALSIQSPTGGIDWIKVAILAAVAWAAWHLYKKGSIT